jgi:hypothetical protein
MAAYKEPRRVTIEKAANGYVVECHSDTGRVIEVAADMKKAGIIAERLLGGKKKK